MTKEIERAGIPTAHICTMLPVAFMVGSPRVVAGQRIVNPMGNAELPIADEKALRRQIALKALQALLAEGSQRPRLGDTAE